jgi:hypothetical protein
MNPLLVDIVGTWVRAALVALSSWLIAHNIVTNEQGQQVQTQLFTKIIESLPMVGAVLWSMWNKYQAKLHLNTALAMTPGSTVLQVEKAVADGKAPPATLPKDAIPYLNPSA